MWMQDVTQNLDPSQLNECLVMFCPKYSGMVLHKYIFIPSSMALQTFSINDFSTNRQ
jgi:hypothetical protein